MHSDDAKKEVQRPKSECASYFYMVHSVKWCNGQKSECASYFYIVHSVKWCNGQNQNALVIFTWYILRPNLFINVPFHAACHEDLFCTLRDTLRWLEPCNVAQRVHRGGCNALCVSEQFQRTT